MEDAAFMPNTMMKTISDNSMDFSLMDEVMYNGLWLETTDGSTYIALDSPSYDFLNYESKVDYLNPNTYQKGYGEETERSFFVDNPPLGYPLIEDFTGSQMPNKETTASLVERIENNRKLGTISIKKRLMQAIEYLKESTRDRDVLIQIWVPVKRAGRHVLTTNNQPFSLNPNCKSLAHYRDVSRSYQFAAEEGSKELFGLPGRVFLKKLPEWTPDVRFFNKEECPRINYAQQYNVRGSLALPVFERGSGTCLGVVEIVTTTQKANYGPELENVYRALQAVDLRSSEISSLPKVKDCNETYQAALAEIREVLKCACDTHRLPLAQTWVPCIQQGKGGCRHSEENYGSCVSTIDSACYVPNPQVLGFHEACSEHHLLKGEGVTGGAFMTNQPCFAADITAFSKTEYPLSHHARMFGLGAAVAIRLRSIFTGFDDFVLEFFLPLECKDAEEQKQILISLSSVIQHVCHSLRVITDQELAEETAFPVMETFTDSGDGLDEENTQKLVYPPSKEKPQDESSWIAHMMEAKKKSKGVSISMGSYQETEEEFKLTTHWDSNEAGLHHRPAFSEQRKIQQYSGPKGSAEGDGDISSAVLHHTSGSRKARGRRPKKAEKIISLQELRRYFSGSLKDAAKSIGVCPTTLKRICRQHGITRWPSRKIKKVGYSLRKLQLVINSVQGVDGAIQLSSFYTNFPELSSSNLPGTSPLSTSKTNDRLKLLNTKCVGSSLSPGTTSSKAHSSSHCCSTGAKQPCVTVNALCSGHSLSAGQPGEVLKKPSSDADLYDLCQDETKILLRSHGNKFFCEHPSLEVVPPLPRSSGQLLGEWSTFRIKATFEEVTIRFSMQQGWGFIDLQQEIVRRFNVNDVKHINLKYLDDDSEWVRLTCDADLEECIDIHRSCGSRTIKLSITKNLGSSLGSSGPS
ncbi:unnamed protein product [Ilex paraguariensis]|uniref:Protein NLP2-like n=1 Tax=Ilex paraguariensis TaxID=185542 RepID=A0ABC8S9K7_9AQUA